MSDIINSQDLLLDIYSAMGKRHFHSAILNKSLNGPLTRVHVSHIDAVRDHSRIVESG